MNYIVCVFNPEDFKVVSEICKRLDLPLTVSFNAKGTAEKSVVDILGTQSTKKKAIVAVANEEKTKAFIKEMKRSIFIDIPNHGVVIAIPVKSVGGGKTLAYLNGNSENLKYVPKNQYSHELIVAIANEGRTDAVMDAARSAGATGGTVLHGKGTSSQNDKKFYNVSLANEKEVVLVVANAENKADIMSEIIKNAGPNTEAGAVVFSLPVSEIAGFGLADFNDE